MAITKTEFFAWLRKTEGPRVINVFSPSVYGPSSWGVGCDVARLVQCKQGKRCDMCKPFLHHQKNHGIDLSVRRTEKAVRIDAAKYQRWLNEFEQSEKEEREGQ